MSIEREPRPEDFDITVEDLDGAPTSFVACHRVAVFLALTALIVATVFAAVLVSGRSLPAAIYFTAVLIGAASILGVPALLCLVCGIERAERWWMCRRLPVLSRCLAFRDERSKWESRPRPSGASTRSPLWWHEAGPTAFLHETERILRRSGWSIETVTDRAAAGFDLVLQDGDPKILARCEPGDLPVSVATARELVACLHDTGASAAWIVSAGGAGPACRQYLEDRPIRVVAPWELAELSPHAPGGDSRNS